LGRWACIFHECGDFPDEIKILFDGYAENDDGTQDESSICYAIFVHKNSGKLGFEFAAHDSPHGLVHHRTEEEACFIVWIKDHKGTIVAEHVTEGDTKLDINIFHKALIKLDKNYYPTE
jgi:hypothetical protein